MANEYQNYNNGYQQPPVPPTPPYIGFGDAIQICFQKYATFTGRATRAEYWWWALFTFIIGAILGSLGFIADFFEYLSGIVNLALLVPSLAVLARRLHDTGRAAGWIFINLIPIVGWILTLIWTLQPSEPIDNRFGPYRG